MEVVFLEEPFHSANVPVCQSDLADCVLVGPESFGTTTPERTQADLKPATRPQGYRDNPRIVILSLEERFVISMPVHGVGP